MRNYRSPLTVLLLMFSMSILARQEIKPLSAIVQGTVVDATTGNPIEGVLVLGPRVGPAITTLAQGQTLRDIADAGRPTTSTEANGGFTLGGLSGGLNVLDFRKPGYLTHSSPHSLLDGQITRVPQVRMSLSSVISGRVFDRAGEPAVGVRVVAFTHAAGITGLRELQGRWQTTTDDRGTFRVIDVPSGRYMIAFQPPLTSSAAERWSAEDTDFTNLAAVLYPGVGSVDKAEFFDVRNGDDIRLTDVAMAASPRLGFIRFEINRTNGAGDDATFWLIGSTPIGGSRGAKPPLGVLPCTSNVRPCTTALRPLQFDPSGSTIRTYWPTTPGIFEAGIRWTDSDGTQLEIIRSIDFTGDNVTVPFTVTRPNGRLQLRALVEEQRGNTVPLPTGGFRICLRGFACSSLSNPSGDIREGTASLQNLVSGEYDFIQLMPPAEFYVAAVTQGDRNALIDGFTVSNAAAPIQVRFRKGPGVIAGKVFDREARPVSNALVALLPDSDLRVSKLLSLTPSVRADQNGLFELTRIIPGRYRLYSWSGVPDRIHLDPQFMARYPDRGIPVEIVQDGRLLLDLTVLAD